MVRTRVVDLAVVAGCAVAGAALAAAAGATTAVDLLVGLAACAALWWRREAPVLVGVLTAVADVVSFAGTPAYVVAVFAVGVRRSPYVVAAVTGVHVVAATLGAALEPGTDEPWWQVALTTALVLGLAGASGLYAGARRDLVDSLRERAARLEADRERDLQDARAAERNRIAGEVHDVLAHRISLISLHAGGLTMTAADEPRVVEAARLIGATARSAMADLRDVIGLLRVEPDDATGPAPPVPTLASLTALVADSREAGLPVDLVVGVADDHLADCPPATGRHAYLVVQEALTNVHKHAPRAATRVRVSGAPGAGLVVEVSNALGDSPHGSRPRPPASGFGLVGLHERVTRAGGTFTSGVVSADTGGDHPDPRRFVVLAELAWS